MLKKIIIGWIIICVIFYILGKIFPNLMKDDDKEDFKSNLLNDPTIALQAFYLFYQKNFGRQPYSIKTIFDIGYLKHEYLNNPITFRREYLGKAFVLFDEISMIEKESGSIILHMGDGEYYKIAQQSQKSDAKLRMENFGDENYKRSIETIGIKQEVYIIGTLSNCNSDGFSFNNCIMLTKNETTLQNFALEIASDWYDENHPEG